MSTPVSIETLVLGRYYFKQMCNGVQSKQSSSGAYSLCEVSYLLSYYS